MAIHLWLFAAILLGAARRGEGRSEPYHCATRPDVVGPCFDLRGRLSFWNGAPSARIWPIGTKRLLGVHADILPPALDAEIARCDPQQRFDTEAWARFTVCPLTRSRVGHMQFVCIEAWRNLTCRRRAE